MQVDAATRTMTNFMYVALKVRPAVSVMQRLLITGLAKKQKQTQKKNSIIAATTNDLLNPLCCRDLVFLATAW